MPSPTARLTRFVLDLSVGRMYRKAGQSVPRLRELDTVLIRSQKPPKGTRITSVRDEVSGDWIRGPGAGTEAVILHLHGGAFVTGSPATHRELAARVSASAGVVVFSPDYRLSPEHPFPAAIHDVLSVYRWLRSQGYPPSRVILGGESSGGGLALQTLLTMKEQGIDLPRAGFFLSPVTDWIGFDGESYGTRAHEDPLLSLAQCRFTAGQYVGSGPADTRLLRPTEMDLSGLPPMWIQVGDHEILLSDAERLAQRAADAGIEVDFKVWSGLWHVFQTTARLVPEARESLEDLGRFIRKHLVHEGGASHR